MAVVFVKAVSIIFVSLTLMKTTEALQCYSCYSTNGSDHRCDDPMIRMYKGVLTPEECVLPVPTKKKPMTPMRVDFVSISLGNETGPVGPVYEIIKDPLREPEVVTLVVPDLYCVKVIGTTTETKENLVIRTCIDKDMNSQCGTFKFKGEKVRGCMLTCQHDLCNSSHRLMVPVRLIMVAIIFIGIYSQLKGFK